MGSSASPPSPWFCHGLDCPLFTNATSSSPSKYELRDYSESLWMSTSIEGIEYDVAVKEGFHRLFNYISGGNEERVKVPMAAPVLVRVTPGAGPTCNSTFEVSFFVPFAFQPTPPAPTSSELRVTRLPAHRFAVASFGGFADWGKYQNATIALATALKNDGVAFSSALTTTAGYDSPFRLFNRHNEVWLPVTATYE